MSHYFRFSLFCVLILSCNQKASQAEKKYIENLEEKNRVLEKELREVKSNKEPNNTTEKTKPKTESPKDYFTIGSTEDEVLDVMGEPTTYHDFPSGRKTFNYDMSSISFEDGKVKSYNNFGGNLKVRVRK